MSVEHLGCITL